MAGFGGSCRSGSTSMWHFAWPSRRTSRDTSAQRRGVDLPLSQWLGGSRVDYDAGGTPTAEVGLWEDPRGGPPEMAGPSPAGEAGADGSAVSGVGRVPEWVAGRCREPGAGADDGGELRPVHEAVHRAVSGPTQAREAVGARRAGLGQRDADALSVLRPREG